MCGFSIEPDTCVRRGQDTFARRGASALVIAKFIPGLNSIGQPLAGALGMPRARFALFDALGALLWVGLYVGVGYALHDQFAQAARLADRLGGWAIAIALTLIALYLGIKYVRRQLLFRELRIARISPEELKRKLGAGEDIMVVDLRTRLAVAAMPYAIPGSRWIDADEIDDRQAELLHARELVVYCS
jgi:hypothetical protein